MNSRRRIIAIVAAIVLILGTFLAYRFGYLGGGTDDNSETATSQNQPVDSDAVASFLDVEGDLVLDGESAHSSAIGASQAVYSHAKFAIYSASDSASLATALELSRAHKVPVFVVDSSADAGTTDSETTDETTDDADRTSTHSDPAVADELTRLGVETLVLVGADAPAEWEGETSQEVPDTADWEAPSEPQNFHILTDAQESAAVVMLENAGGTAIVSPADPRESSEAIAALADSESVVAAFEGDTTDLPWQIATARTGTELPGGGQVVFNGKRYIALYGSPMTDALGVLGEQGVEATVQRAADMAAEYDVLTDDTVVPALEIIVTVASGSAGADGNYSGEWAVEHFIPLIEAAQEAGQYVVLDFQPGRSDFLSQVQMYEELLKYPHVGIALDPEWRLGPDELPLTRIGHVEIAEVNEVVNYLADFVQENNLPQKLIILHQFQVQMLRDIDQLDRSRAEVAILVHADGQGGQGAKASTWQTLLNNAPHIEYWGWKNFYDEDLPMLTPAQTYEVEPLPHFVSYQ